MEEASGVPKNLTLFERIVAIVIVVFLFGTFFILPPRDFPAGVPLMISEGDSLKTVVSYLDENRVIRSARAMSLIVRLFGSPENIKAGEYYFEKPINTFGIISRISNGVLGQEPIRVTLHEGTSLAQMAEIFEMKFVNFDTEEFLELTKDKEGYLFPDTYFFLKNVGAEQIAKKMFENFQEKIISLEQEIVDSGKTLHEILTMASLIEKEVSNWRDRRIVSGILWDRIDIGMALQVDASFRYINGKGTFDLTLEDLASEHPYNTYKHPGLPPGPITNPGLDAIDAALYPEKSPYLFYLSDFDGVTHYAVTFEEHKVNKEKYLR